MRSAKLWSVLSHAKGVIIMPSISISKGRGSLNHNLRKYHTPNVDQQRTVLNRVLVNQELQQVYHELFDEALERYNSKQKRADRKIKNYLQHVRSDKKTKEFHELVVQIGNKDDVQNLDPNVLADMLQQYLADFETRNPQLKVFSAIIHMDEATPHLHLDYVGWSTGNKRGLDTRVAHDKALQQMGHSDYASWRASELSVLENVLQQNGLERTVMHNTDKRLSVEAFKRLNRAIEAQISDLEPICDPLPPIPTKKTLSGSEVVKMADIEPILTNYQNAQARISLLEQQNQLLLTETQEQAEIIAKMRSKRYRTENKELQSALSQKKFELRNQEAIATINAYRIQELENELKNKPKQAYINKIIRTSNYNQAENERLSEEVQKLTKENKNLVNKVRQQMVDQDKQTNQITSLTDTNKRLQTENKSLKSLVNRLLHCIETIIHVVTKWFEIDPNELDTQILETDESAWQTLKDDTNIDLAEAKRDKSFTR